jgi:hypothetical protein
MSRLALVRQPAPRLSEGIVDVGEFEKLEGCVTCLPVRIRGARDAGGRAIRPSQSDGRWRKV